MICYRKVACAGGGSALFTTLIFTRPLPPLHKPPMCDSNCLIASYGLYVALGIAAFLFICIGGICFCVPSPKWTTHLYGCFCDCGSCWAVICCPHAVYGQMYSRLVQRGSCAVVTSTMVFISLIMLAASYYSQPTPITLVSVGNGVNSFTAAAKPAYAGSSFFMPKGDIYTPPIFSILGVGNNTKVHVTERPVPPGVAQRNVSFSTVPNGTCPAGDDITNEEMCVAAVRRVAENGFAATSTWSSTWLDDFNKDYVCHQKSYDTVPPLSNCYLRKQVTSEEVVDFDSGSLIWKQVDKYYPCYRAAGDDVPRGPGGGEPDDLEYYALCATGAMSSPTSGIYLEPVADSTPKMTIKLTNDPANYVYNPNSFQGNQGEQMMNEDYAHRSWRSFTLKRLSDSINLMSVAGVIALILTIKIRGALRRKKEIPEGCLGGCEDLCVSMWCAPCVLCQVMREDQVVGGAACCSIFRAEDGHEPTPLATADGETQARSHEEKAYDAKTNAAAWSAAATVVGNV